MDHKHKNRCKTVTPTIENTGKSLYDLELGNEFLDITPKTWSIGEKITKFNLIEIKNIFSGKILYDLELGNEFLDITPKTWSIGEKITKFNLIEIKNIFFVKTLFWEWKDKMETRKTYL